MPIRVYHAPSICQHRSLTHLAASGSTSVHPPSKPTTRRKSAHFPKPRLPARPTSRCFSVQPRCTPFCHSIDPFLASPLASDTRTFTPFVCCFFRFLPNPFHSTVSYATRSMSPATVSFSDGSDPRNLLPRSIECERRPRDGSMSENCIFRHCPWVGTSLPLSDKRRRRI
ncbi:hypothetical protein BC827DRAFT_22497 [Russula dissimulans]|nr:hypothetical protein BC827DRAFT_22497 [Russula dissimulans]